MKNRVAYEKNECTYGFGFIIIQFFRYSVADRGCRMDNIDSLVLLLSLPNSSTSTTKDVQSIHLEMDFYSLLDSVLARHNIVHSVH